MKYLPLIAVATLMFIPDLASAAFVPCSGTDCAACHFVQMGNTILVWLIGILFVVFAVVAVIAGFGLVTSGGNPSAKQAAKDKLVNAVIGLIIVLAAWLLVDTVMRGLLTGGEGRIEGYGVWSSIECVGQVTPLYSIARIYHPTPDESRGIAIGLDTEILTPDELAALRALDSNDDKVFEAAMAAGLDEEQARNLQALMRVESASCSNKVSAVGALGCMQIMPDTARQYDPALRDLSDAELTAKLRDDDDYNIALGAVIYEDLYTSYDGDERKIYAGYNGGPGANLPSSDCPGLMRWECEWDDPEHTIPNTGYIETRNYVEKVGTVSESLI